MPETSDNRSAFSPELPPLLQRFVAAITQSITAVYELRRKLATVAVLLLAGVVAYHAVFGANGMVVYQKKRSDYKLLQKEVDRLQIDNQQMAEQIKALRTDPKAIEKEAREQLRYARPGEVIYILPGQKRTDTPRDTDRAQKR